MEEEKEDHHHKNNHQPRKTLNLNAPLLSTRRPANLTAIDLSSCPSVRGRRSSHSDDHRIPFSWEKAPGKPKENPTNEHDDDDNNADTTPRRPKLPPSLWRYRHLIAAAAKNDNDDENKDNDNDDDDDDVFSLSEAIDIVEKSEAAVDNGLRMKMMEDRSKEECGNSDGDGGRFPDFIIQRFLPDAAAMAAASLEEIREAPHAGFSPPNKGCGIESVLFRWRGRKHHLCGVRRHDVDVVVRRGSPNNKHKRWGFS